jgi:hypothetical protein
MRARFPQLTHRSSTAPLLAIAIALGGAACTGAATGSAPGERAFGAGAPPPAVGPAPGPAPTPAPTMAEMCRQRALPPARTPLRRLTRFEYNNTVRDLLGDTTSPANLLPAEELGNGFGNDTAGQAVSSLLAEQYASVAEGIAARATATPAVLARLHACGASVTPAAEETCARTIVEGFTPRAFRRPLASGEADSLLALYRSTRAVENATFATAIAAVLEAILQSPDFLYRIELGVADPGRPGFRRPTGDEMAARLSYFLWGSMPDEPLRAAARSGALDSATGVREQATRMLADMRARKMVRFFFDNLLPISGLHDLERDKALYPTFTPAIGALMQEETQRLLEYEIFTGSGTWPGALTAPYTFLNAPLAAYYKIPGVQTMGFQKVSLTGTPRLGLLTQGSLMAGTTHSNHTNPVTRGSFVVQKLLCMKVPLPDASIAEKVKPPDPYSGKTARERYSAHQEDPVCKSCHAVMDPVGLALENFDPVGLYRTTENGVTIDVTGAVPGVDGPISGAVELGQKLATTEAAQSCFVGNWLQLAFGKTIGPDDACLQAQLDAAFEQSGHNVRELLLALTQTDAFLYGAGE